MKKITLPGLCLATVLAFTACQDNNSDNNSPENESFYEIVNNGDAGVSIITDVNDTAPLSVAQAIPSVPGQQYPVNAPVLFFFNDKILLPSVTEDSFIVTQNGNQVSGIVSVNEASNGYAILTFTPENPFSANADIQVTITPALQDDGGQSLDQEMTYNYTTFSEPSDGLGSSVGFENGSEGMLFIGDGNILSGTIGCFDPFAGSSFAAITTGTQLVSGGDAIGGASSGMILGPFDSDVSSVSFKYNFLSAEFTEWVNSEYDDSFMAVVYGENGAHAELINTVNLIGSNNTQCDGFPGMPDQGDGYAGSTDWITKEINFGSIQGPVYVIFIATDVADQIYSTVVGIDDVEVN